MIKLFCKCVFISGGDVGNSSEREQQVYRLKHEQKNLALSPSLSLFPYIFLFLLCVSQAGIQIFPVFTWLKQWQPLHSNNRERGY